MVPITIDLPSSIPVSKKSRFALNMNQYRNAHFHVLNKAKVEFTNLISPLVQHIPLQTDPIQLHYRLFVRDSRESDVNNVCSIVDKFFSDTLTKCGVIADDNYKHLVRVTSEFGGIDRGNPRVEVTISRFSPETEAHQPKRSEDDMKIELDAESVKKALLKLLEDEYCTIKPGKIAVPHFDTDVFGNTRVIIEIVDGKAQSGKPVGNSPANVVTHRSHAADELADALTGTASATPVIAGEGTTGDEVKPEPVKRGPKKFGKKTTATETAAPSGEPEGETAPLTPEQQEAIENISGPLKQEDDGETGDSSAENTDENTDENEDPSDDESEDGDLGDSSESQDQTGDREMVEPEDAPPRGKLKLFKKPTSSAPEPDRVERKSMFKGLKRPLNAHPKDEE